MNWRNALQAARDSNAAWWLRLKAARLAGRCPVCKLHAGHAADCRWAER